MSSPRSFPTRERVKVNKVEILLAGKGKKALSFCYLPDSLKKKKGCGRECFCYTSSSSQRMIRYRYVAHRDARWLMIKPYINVRYDRLHRDGVWNANDAVHQLSAASFNLRHMPEQPLRLGW